MMHLVAKWKKAEFSCPHSARIRISRSLVGSELSSEIRFILEMGKREEDERHVELRGDKQFKKGGRKRRE